MYPNGRPKGRNQNYLGNKRCQCLFKHNHRSKLEASLCHNLHAFKKAGEIGEIYLEVKIYLTDAKIGYFVDFKCVNIDQTIFYAEAKGKPNDTWHIKKKLWKFYGPGPLHIYKGHYKKLELDEIIVPTHTM